MVYFEKFQFVFGNMYLVPVTWSVSVLGGNGWST